MTDLRIASLLPSATEVVAALGLAGNLVGVSHECDYPPDVRRLPKLTRSLLPEEAAPALVDRLVSESLHTHRTLYRLDDELLRGLRPDVVLTQELCDVCAVRYDHVERAIRTMGGDGASAPRLISLEPSSLGDVLASIAGAARELGVPERGEAVVAALRARLDAVAAAGRALAEHPTVLLLEWTDPPYTGGHWVAEMVELAGGRNAAPQAERRGLDSVRTTWDALATADPDVVVVAPCGYRLEGVVAEVARTLSPNPTWRSLRAVRDRQVWCVDANSYFSRSGPRLVDGVELLHAILRDRPESIEGKARRTPSPQRSPAYAPLK